MVPKLTIDAFDKFLQLQSGVPLADDWLNNGPEQLGDVLPQGWEARLQTVFKGQSLELHTLGRADLLKSKLFAYCDRGTDEMDCIALAPTDSELNAAREWLVQQDAHPGWPDHVNATLQSLAERLQHGI